MGEDDRRVAIDILHGFSRFNGGGNIFKLPVDPNEFIGDEEVTVFEGVDTSSPTEILGALRDSEEGQYYIGTFSASLLLIMFMLVWCLSLPFIRCRCKAQNGNCSRLLIFFITLNVGTFAWFLSLTGFSYLTDGVSVGTNNAGEVSADLRNLVEQLDLFLASGDDLDNFADTVEAQCGTLLNLDNSSTDEFDFSALPSSEDLEIVTEARDEVNDIPDKITDIIEFVDDNTEAVQRYYRLIVISLITFLVIFNITTIIGFFCRGSESWLTSLSICLNRIGCIIMFTLGLVFVLLSVTFLAIIGPIATIGADACVPGFNTTVANQLQLVVNVRIEDFCFVEADFDSLTAEEQASWAFCHYTRCDPPDNNLLFDTAGIDLDENGVFAGMEILDELQTEIENAQFLIGLALISDLEGADTCNQELESGIELKDLLEDVITEGINFASCAELSPLLDSTVNEGVCNGIVAGLSFIFVSWAVAICMLMIALCFYIQLDFSLGDDDWGDMDVRDNSFSDTNMRGQYIYNSFKA